MPNLKETYETVVVGAGHAGCEAALAAARLGKKTAGGGFQESLRKKTTD